MSFSLLFSFFYKIWTTYLTFHFYICKFIFVIIVISLRSKKAKKKKKYKEKIIRIHNIEKKRKKDSRYDLCFDNYGSYTINFWGRKW